MTSTGFEERIPSWSTTAWSVNSPGLTSMENRPSDPLTAVVSFPSWSTATDLDTGERLVRTRRGLGLDGAHGSELDDALDGPELALALGAGLAARTEEHDEREGGREQP